MLSLHSEKLATHIANITALLVACILCVRFSRAYSSYAFAIFALFVIYDLTCFRKPAVFSLSALRPIRIAVIGFFTFYGLCILSAFLLQDTGSVEKGFDYMSLGLPFFIFYLLRAKYDIDTGFGGGILLGGFAICLGAFLFLNPENSPRMQSFFPHPNGFAAVLELFLPFSLYCIFRAKYPVLRIFSLLLFPLLLYCLWHTESRGAMVGLASAASLSLLLYVFARRKLLSRKTICLSLLFAVLSTTLGFGAFTQITEERSAWGKMGGERLLMIESSYKMWQDHKLLGIGLANWQEAYYSELYHPAEGKEPGLDMPHNMPIYFFSTAGLLGGSGFLIFLSTFCFTLYRGFTRSEHPLLALAAMTMFFAFIFHGLVDTTFIHKEACRIFYLLIGYCFSLLYCNQFLKEKPI